MNLAWTKGLFSYQTKLIENGDEVGFVQYDPWSEKVAAQLYGKGYKFERKGLFSSTMLIKNPKDNTVIGSIDKNIWNSVSTISIDSNKATFKTRNFWSTKWSVKLNDDEVNYHGNSSKGSITINGKIDPVYVLSGLFSVTYHLRTAGIVAIFVAVVVSVSNM
ncbi:MAG: hypothetical protein AAFX87_19080 [Bacteroidota bacterium]